MNNKSQSSHLNLTKIQIDNQSKPESSWFYNISIKKILVYTGYLLLSVINILYYSRFDSKINELSNYVYDIQDNNLYLVAKQVIEYSRLLNNSLFILLFISLTYDILSFLLYLFKHSHTAFMLIYIYTSDEHNENKDLYSMNYIQQTYSRTTLNLFVYMITKGFSSMIITYFSYSILQIISNLEYRYSYSKPVFNLLKDGKNVVEVIFYLTLIEIFCSVMSFISIYYSLYQIDKIRIVLSNRELNRKYAIIYNTSLEVDSK